MFIIFGFEGFFPVILVFASVLPVIPFLLVLPEGIATAVVDVAFWHVIVLQSCLGFSVVLTYINNQ